MQTPALYFTSRQQTKMYEYDYDQFGHTDSPDYFQPELKATQTVAFDANILHCIALHCISFHFSKVKNMYD